MTFETTITDLHERYLANTRAPNIAEFVEQLFRVATTTGGIAGRLLSADKLRFFVDPEGGQTARLPVSCVVEHPAARAILRMICARLGVLSQEHTASEFSPYGQEAVWDRDGQGQKRWHIAFVNTSDRQEFAIVAL